MPQTAPTVGSGRNPTLSAIAELALDQAGNGMRVAEAARILVLARRAAALAEGGRAAVVDLADASSRAVIEISRHWNPDVVTAAEYAESLPVVVLERLLRAAPAWAERLTAPELRHAA